MKERLFEVSAEAMQLQHDQDQASGRSQEALRRTMDALVLAQRLQLEEANELIRELRRTVEHAQQRAEALEADYRQSQLKMTEEHARSLLLKTQLEQAQQEVQQQLQQTFALQVQLAQAQQEIQQCQSLVGQLKARRAESRSDSPSQLHDALQMLEQTAGIHTYKHTHAYARLPNQSFARPVALGCMLVACS